MAGLREYTNLKYQMDKEQQLIDDLDDLDDDLLAGDDSLDEDNAHLPPDDQQLINAMLNLSSVGRGPSPSEQRLYQRIKRQQQQKHRSSNEHQPSAPTQPGQALQYHYVNSERDFTLPLRQHRNHQSPFDSPESDDVSMRKYIGVSVGLVSLITENLLSHPFLVLRRQCQVHHTSGRFHLLPFTLVPVIVHLHQRQGVTTLWKGLGSCLLVRGMSLAVEDVLSKVTPWPKDVHSGTTLRQFGQHLLLKCAGLAAVVPFYAASLVETVQSDIASEKPGVFDVFREGLCRVAQWSVPQKGRMLPLWALLGPAVGLGIAKYVFGLSVKNVSTRIMQYRLRCRHERNGARPRDADEQQQDIEIYSTLMSLVSTEVLFYPLETVLHRMQLQGTRTIIDNLDSGYSVVPILTSYEGAADCYRTTLATEGVGGLYKGFGAMLLQFAAHLAVIRLTKWVVTQIGEAYSCRPPAKVTEYYNLDAATTAVGKPSLDFTPSRSISRSMSSQSVE